MSLIRDLQQLREDVNKLQEGERETTVLTRIFKSYSTLRIRVRLRHVAWARGRYCSEETYCAEEARLR